MPAADVVSDRVARLEAERDEARAALDRVRELHGEVQYVNESGSRCCHEGHSWPCPTISAIEAG